MAQYSSGLKKTMLMAEMPYRNASKSILKKLECKEQIALLPETPSFNSSSYNPSS
jgi:hypothetical protein